MPDMRFAPPSALRVDSTEGLNPSRVRTHNDRLVLSLLRQHGQLSRMEITQITGLSPQTVSVIVRALEKDGLCVPGEIRKGKVGPPSTPMSLNPDGAFSFGFHIGLRGARAVLVDLLGNIRDRSIVTYPSPPIADLCAWILRCHAEMCSALPSEFHDRVAGLGIVLSSDFEEMTASGQEQLSLPGLETDLKAATGLDVYVQHDVTAAASAEVIFGNAAQLGDFAYVFIGRCVEMRLVLNHRIYAGGVSSALQPVNGLEAFAARLGSEPADTAFLWDPNEPWPDVPAVAAWTAKLSEQLAGLATIACGIVGVRKLALEGDLPEDVIGDIVDRTLEVLSGQTGGENNAWEVRSGKVGRFAKAVGAASAPLYARFMDEAVGITGFLDRRREE